MHPRRSPRSSPRATAIAPRRLFLPRPPPDSGANASVREVYSPETPKPLLKEYTLNSGSYYSLRKGFTEDLQLRVHQSRSPPEASTSGTSRCAQQGRVEVLPACTAVARLYSKKACTTTGCSAKAAETTPRATVVESSLRYIP